MKVSRLELLKEEINWELIQMYDKDYQLISESLREEARLELERQAGILGDSVSGARKRIDGIVNSDFYGKNFSERVWGRTGMYQSTQKEVYKSLSRIYTTMDGYRNERNRLMDKMQTTEYETMRLLRTENARIGSQMQVEAYKANEFTHFIYVAEPGACDICGPLDGKLFPIEDAQIGLNLKPLHPNCRCSSYGYTAMERIADDKWIDEVTELDRQAFEQVLEGFEPLNLESDEGMVDWFDGIKDLEDIGIDDPASMYRGMEEELFTENARQIKRLENRFKLTEKFDTLKVDTVGTGAEVAFVKYGPTTPQNVELNFSKDLYSKPKSLVSKVKSNVESGFFMPVGQSETELALYPITHEYGHLVQTSLFKEELLKNGWSPSNPRQFVDANSLDGRFHWYDKIKNDMVERHYDEIVGIAKRNNPEFSLDDNVSEYGKTIKEEFFAEAFVNSQLGEPNEIGKAMNTWLDSKGLITK